MEIASDDEATEAAAMAAFEHCMEQGWVADGVISQSEAQAQQIWRLREGITEAVARYKPYKNDVSVRISAMPAFLAQTMTLSDIVRAPRSVQAAVLRRAWNDPGYVARWSVWHLKRLANRGRSD